MFGSYFEYRCVAAGFAPCMAKEGRGEKGREKLLAIIIIIIIITLIWRSLLQVNIHSMAPYTKAYLNKWVLSLRLKDKKSVQFCRSKGKSFHLFGASTAKARSPKFTF